MKFTKSIAAASMALALFAFTGCNKKSADGKKSVKIGIAKIVQHIALDSVEQGIIDVLKEMFVNQCAVT